MESVIIKDKRFEVNIPAAKIDQRVKELGAKLNEDLKNTRPIFVSVLNGSFMFAADLFREIKMEAEITFIRVSSYSGTESTGTVKSVVGIKENLEGRTVVIIEDIVDTGDTAIYLIDELKKQNPEKVLFASLLLKPDALRHPIKIDYVGFEVPNDFLVGYGLDYDGLGRNLKDIYKLA
ncbi:MAG: hypoxanthine phosphoribosyltransferase [Bacteroidetes bacterium]|jgi:hypoxanthine phosphoribosyltransferase|nr:hypoxanthine phosphoribosyltransferase [Bacteroidota bacterium]MBK8365817.1 hypoxanthine phosphoribosyltransferase [Bacteroidota bacterium]MBK9412515.1 hypoxanthine phosphoribosyltransferase [Bacteroidota bacterium]MBP6427965.1 hypoxanthine phosphoribosyltransferase [Bacteroidia bacterium]